MKSGFLISRDHFKIMSWVYQCSKKGWEMVQYGQHYLSPVCILLRQEQYPEGRCGKRRVALPRTIPPTSRGTCSFIMYSTWTEYQLLIPADYRSRDTRYRSRDTRYRSRETRYDVICFNLANLLSD